MPEALKRLGGGRWETRDGRFAIEPQSGTWGVVDTEQVDDLGLPLVRGPFASLTAAKAAIDEVRAGAPPASPLAREVAAAHRQAREGGRGTRAKRATRGKAGAAAEKVPEPEPSPPPPPPPKVPRWLHDLEPPDRRRADALIERLAAAGVHDAEELARDEIVREQPAVARLAIERRLSAAMQAGDPVAAVRAALAAILAGSDESLRSTWRLVDGAGREIRSIDPQPETGGRGGRRR